MRRYSGDPRKITARFNSRCSECKSPLKRGDNIFYFPASRSAYCLKCGEPRFREFLSSAADEEAYHGGNPMA